MKGGDQVVRAEKVHAVRDAQRAAEVFMHASGPGAAAGQPADGAALSAYERWKASQAAQAAETPEQKQDRLARERDASRKLDRGLESS